jgi:hypothetical protein
VPNQDSFSKFLIREGITVQIPDRQAAQVPGGVSQNGTGPHRIIQVIRLVSFDYDTIPVPGLEIPNFPSWNQSGTKMTALLARLSNVAFFNEKATFRANRLECVPPGLNRLRKKACFKAESPEKHPSGAKAHAHFVAFTARLKSCPDASSHFKRVFPQPVKPALILLGLRTG